MINWFDMPAEGLSNGGLFEIKELEVTENGTYETSGEMYNKVTVNVEGGGGSSDFSTAEVTIVLAEDIQILPASLPVCTDFVDPEYPEDNYSGIEVNNSAESGKYIIPLYKGFCYLYFDELTGDISVTGNATISSGVVTTVIITGDCTINIS